MRAEHFDANPGRILLLNDGSVPQIYELRAKYHLLPLASGQGKGRLRQADPGNFDYVLAMSVALDADLARQVAAGSSDAWNRLRVPARFRGNFQPVAFGEFGVLLAPSGR